jgi:hypothetical protein
MSMFVARLDHMHAAHLFARAFTVAFAIGILL